MSRPFENWVDFFINRVDIFLKPSSFFNTEQISSKYFLLQNFVKIRNFKNMDYVLFVDKHTSVFEFQVNFQDPPAYILWSPLVGLYAHVWDHCSMHFWIYGGRFELKGLKLNKMQNWNSCASFISSKKFTETRQKVSYFKLWSLVVRVELIINWVMQYEWRDHGSVILWQTVFRKKKKKITPKCKIGCKMSVCLKYLLISEALLIFPRLSKPDFTIDQSFPL